MATRELDTYREALTRCRFCPMCKPTGEVSNLTLLESHTTRARAMYLWRMLNGSAEQSARQAELLYQSTLDSISEAWCVSHYPVSAYVAAGRAEILEAGWAPRAVLAVLERPAPEPSALHADVVLLGGEAAEAGDEAALLPALRLLQGAGVKAVGMVASAGALAYCLGDWGRARVQAGRVAERLRESGAHLVIADGPQTLWALRRIYPSLGVSLPPDLTIASWSGLLAGAVREGRFSLAPRVGVKVFVHDSRCATLVSDTLPDAEAIQPGYRGPEEKLGTGEVYDAPRRLVDAAGGERVFSVWSRSLARSCGADDGLWLTYPTLAGGLARQRLADVTRLGAEVVVTDSFLSARHMAQVAGPGGLPVCWLPEWLEAA